MNFSVFPPFVCIVSSAKAWLTLQCIAASKRYIGNKKNAQINRKAGFSLNAQVEHTGISFFMCTIAMLFVRPHNNDPPHFPPTPTHNPLVCVYAICAILI